MIFQVTNHNKVFLFKNKTRYRQRQVQFKSEITLSQKFFFAELWGFGRKVSLLTTDSLSNFSSHNQLKLSFQALVLFLQPCHSNGIYGLRTIQKSKTLIVASPMIRICSNCGVMFSWKERGCSAPVHTKNCDEDSIDSSFAMKGPAVGESTLLVCSTLVSERIKMLDFLCKWFWLKLYCNTNVISHFKISKAFQVSENPSSISRNCRVLFLNQNVSEIIFNYLMVTKPCCYLQAWARTHFIKARPPCLGRRILISILRKPCHLT